MAKENNNIKKLRSLICGSLKAARIMAGISRNKMAKDNELTYAQVISIEEGSTNFGIDRLLQLCIYLNVNIHITPDTIKISPYDRD